MKNPKRGPKLGSRSDTPRNPEQVRRIVLLRDQQGLRFLEIAKALAPERVLTESAAHAAYKKWRAWVYKGTNSTTLIQQETSMSQELVNDVNPNDVTIAGVVVPRPAGVSVSRWMDFWENADSYWHGDEDWQLAD